MTRYNAYNNWESNLGANSGGSISDSDTEIKVGGIVDGEIPALPFKITVEDEIMNVTGAVYNGTGEYIFTVERGQEGTTAVSHSDGVVVENRLTAEVQNKMWDTIEQHIAETTSADDVHSSKTYADTKVTKAGDTMSGELNMSDNLLTRPKIKDYGETAVIATGVNGAVTIDLENGNVVRHTLSGNVTYTFSNPPASGTAGSFTVIIEQPATAVTITWPTSVKWSGDDAPPAPGNSKVAIYTFITTDGGTRWYGMLAGTGFVI